MGIAPLHPCYERVLKKCGGGDRLAFLARARKAKKVANGLGESIVVRGIEDAREYTYPLTGDMFMPEHWPIEWDQYRVTWTVNEGKAESVTVAVRTADLSGLPRIDRNPRPGLAANIHIGDQPYRNEVQSILRTASGLLGFFAHSGIDFERPTIEWEAETAEERAKLQMYSYKVEPSAPKEPLAISYDLVARCFLSSIPASEKEIPLSFMARGRRAMQTGQYIDAYYSYFFFFETQFAPGLSNPKRVSAKLKATAEVAGAMEEAREMANQEVRRARQMGELLRLSDDALIDLLVETRGKLHHHALPRRTGSWHPEKHDEFESEALFLSFLAHVVSQRQNVPLLFGEAVTMQMMEGAKREGAEYMYLVEAEGGDDRYGLNGIPMLRISLPSRSPSHKSLATIEEGIRRENAAYDLMAVRSYAVKSTDGSQVFASYKNYTFPDGKN
jgi:hypothetical protein